MTRFQTLLCFTILLATVTFFNVASAHIKITPALPQIGDPTTVSEVESYTVKVVSTFVADLEKECPKTEKFKHFFEKVNAYSKYVCSVSNVKGSESEMKAKAGSLFQAISDLGSCKNASKGGKMSKSLKKEKTEAMNTVKMLQSIGEKIGGEKNNKTEMKLTVEQQKEIKDGMLKWLQVITSIAKTTEEISLQYSSKTQTSRESKEEKSSSRTEIKTSSRAAKAGNKKDDSSKSDKKSKKEKDDKKNKKGESKKNTKSTKEDGKGKGSSKSKGESGEKADKKPHTSYGKIEPKKGGVEPPRNKTEERLRAEMADELD